MKRSPARYVLFGFLLVIAGALWGCGGDGSSSENAITLNDNEGKDYNPGIDPANFVRDITNPYLALPVGTTRIYEGTNEDGKPYRTELEVTSDTKTIMGVTTTVLRDRAYLEDELVEDTLDWVAQDRDGTVWYFGEESKELQNGRVVSTEGSWEAGKDGAKAGIIMLASPRVGDTYRQEYLKGEAEGAAEVLSVAASVSIRQGAYQDCVQIKEWAPDEPSVVEHKFYCLDARGLVLTELVSGESGRTELVSTRAVGP